MVCTSKQTARTCASKQTAAVRMSSSRQAAYRSRANVCQTSSTCQCIRKEIWVSSFGYAAKEEEIWLPKPSPIPKFGLGSQNLVTLLEMTMGSNSTLGELNSAEVHPISTAVPLRQRSDLCSPSISALFPASYVFESF